MSTWRWGTVTSTSPLRVRLPGEPVTDVTPITLVPVTTGDRVWCQLEGGSLIIHGKAVPQ